MRVPVIGSRLLYEREDEEIYAVNGVAKGNKRFADVREILRDHTSVAGSKVDIGPILDRGLKLC